MTLLLLANHLTSGVVVLTCWWLAHLTARAHPPGRLVAAGYGLIGLSVLATALVRSLPAPDAWMPWLIVLSKALLGLTFLLTILRRAGRGPHTTGDPDA